MTMFDLNVLCSSAEAAQILGTSSGTVSRMGQGTHQSISLERIRIGREFFYSRREVEAAVPFVRHRKDPKPAAVTPPAPAEPTVTQADRVDEMRAALMQEIRKLTGKVDYLIGLDRTISAQTSRNTDTLRLVMAELGVKAA